MNLIICESAIAARAVAASEKFADGDWQHAYSIAQAAAFVRAWTRWQMPLPPAVILATRTDHGWLPRTFPLTEIDDTF